jgi:hypothetical protein
MNRAPNTANPGSARASRVGFGASPKQSFPEKFAMAMAPSLPQARDEGARAPQI